MTKTTCDGCGVLLPSGYGIAPLKVITFVLPGDRRCVTRDEHTSGQLTGAPGYIRQFNTTDISMCAECVWGAFKSAVAAM